MYDIPVNNYTQIITEAENNIVKDLIRKPAEETKEKGKSINLGELLTKFAILYGTKSKPAKKPKKEVALLENKSTSSEKSLSSDQSSTISVESNVKVKKYKSFLDLPKQMHNQIVEHWNLNDLAAIADVAESEKCTSVAIYARGVMTERFVN